MRSKLVVTVLVAISLQVQAKDAHPDQATASNTQHGTEPHWSYSSGAADPAHWGHLSEEYATCSQGQAQSPIDITDSVPSKLPPLEFAYQAVPLVIENNGHTIKVTTDQAGTLKIGKDSYQLKQFHTHSPSEEAINGKRTEMVVHLVHQNEAGQLAVVAVLFEKGEMPNPVMSAIVPVMPKEEGPAQKHEKIQINPADLLPKDKNYFTYEGSLTTPPCSEGVRWIVLKTPVTLTEKELSPQQAIYSGNARPLQPLNDRKVLSSN
jgi:carbonic anhydrase